MSKFSFVLFFLVTILARSYCNVRMEDFFTYGKPLDLSIIDEHSGNLDDGSSPQIKLSRPFRFYGVDYNSLWVNINGGVSFRSPISKYTPECTALTENMAMISPFWADVDLSGGRGDVFYRQTNDSNVLNKALIDIKKVFPEVSRLDWALIASWIEVPFFNDIDCKALSNKRNTFQMVLVTENTNSFVIFNYNKIEWTTGTASGSNGCNGLGGAPARAGFDDGFGHLTLVPHSCTQDILKVVDETLGLTPGKYIFLVSENKIIVPVTGSTLQVITNNDNTATRPLQTTKTPTPSPTTRPTNPPNTTPTIISRISSSTSFDDKSDFEILRKNLNHKLDELNKRLIAIDCKNLIERPSLQKHCYQQMERIDNMFHELSITTEMDELILIENDYMEILEAVEHIEKDIGIKHY